MRHGLAWMWLAAFCLIGCNDEEPTGTRAGWRGVVTITVAVEGNGYDPDGMYWVIGHSRSGLILPGTPVTVTEVAEGDHSVSLTSLAPHCEMQPFPDEIRVRDGETTSVTLTVHCVSGLTWTQYHPTGWFEVVHLNADGTLRSLTPLTEHSFPREWSPDGTRLIIERYEDPDTGPVSILTNPDLYAVRVDGAGRQQLTSFPGSDFDPRWSPDGTRIVHSRWNAGFRLGIIQVDPAVVTHEVVSLTGDYFDAAWLSPTRIVFACTRTGTASLCTMDANGTNVTRLLDAPDAREPRPSPDGQSIAFTAQHPNGRGLLVARNDGSGLIDVAPGKNVVAAEWSPTGQQLAFTTADRRVYRVDRGGANLIELARFESWDGFSGLGDHIPRWSPDGAWIAYAARGAVYIMRPDGSGARIIHDHWIAKNDVIWHPQARPGAAPSLANVAAATH